MNKIALAALLSTTVVLAVPTPAQAQGQDQRYRQLEVTCSSQHGNYRSCRLPERGHARLVRQLSGSACVRGRSWGEKGSSSVWVSHGCRGVFAVQRNHHDDNRDGRYGDNRDDDFRNGDNRDGRYGDQGDNGWVRDRNYAVACQANGRRTNCDWDSRYGNPYIVQRNSGECIEGRDWGYDSRGGIWVDADCNARFGYR